MNSEALTQLHDELASTLDELEALGTRWIEARAGGHSFTCTEIDAKAKEVEARSRRIERRIHKLNKKERTT